MLRYKELIYLWPDTDAPFTLECGPHPQPSLVPFPVEGSRGAMIVCPGGGYKQYTLHEGVPVAQMVNQAGISAFVLNYRLTPCPAETPLTDALRAIRVVRSLGYDKVGIMGFSAGGHIAACAATLYTPGDPDSEDPIERLSSRPDAFAPCYGVISMHAFIRTARFLEGVENNRELARRYSAEENVTPDTPPCFMWQTADDKAVAAEHNLRLALALRTADVPFELHIFPEGHHGLSLAVNHPIVAQWIPMFHRWLTDLGFGT